VEEGAGDFGDEGDERGLIERSPQARCWEAGEVVEFVDGRSRIGDRA